MVLLGCDESEGHGARTVFAAMALKRILTPPSDDRGTRDRLSAVNHLEHATSDATHSTSRTVTFLPPPPPATPKQRARSSSNSDSACSVGSAPFGSSPSTCTTPA